MQLRRLAVASVAAAALAVAPAAAGARHRVPAFPHIPGNWSHAELNVTVGGTAHTLILDRGRVVRVSKGSLLLRERDGTRVPIPLVPATKVVVDGFNATTAALGRGMDAETMRIDGGAAVRVRATG